jgi:glycine/D-amino acid oxidase-like deaminating enzyme
VKHTPFWIDDHPRPENLTSDLPGDCDVAIVGSGLTGLSAAVRLAEGGRSVAVIEGGEIASGASSMNGGMVSADVKAGIRAVFERYGPELGQEMWEATVRSVDMVTDHTRRYKLDSRIVRGGITSLGMRPSDLDGFQRQVSWYRENLGVDWEVLGPERIGEVVGGSERFSCGIYKPEGIGIQPAGFAFGLARAARDAGAELVSACVAESVEASAGGLDLRTSRGTVRAGDVIVATNGYTTERPIAELYRKIVPIGSYVVVTEPLPEAEAKAIFPTDSMAFTKRRLLNYMRRTPDNRILLGGRRNLKTGLDLDGSAADLRNRLIEFWPHLDGKAITHVWGGKLGVPFDLIPHLAMGYAGHGVGLSTLLGNDLAGMLLREDPPSVFTKIPFVGRPYYRGRPWFLAPASYLYRALDRVGM